MFAGFVDGQAIHKGKRRIQGGQTLRDTLFAATEIRKLAKPRKTSQSVAHVKPAKQEAMPSMLPVANVVSSEATTNKGLSSLLSKKTDKPLLLTNETQSTPSAVRERRSVWPKRLIQGHRSSEFFENPYGFNQF